MKRVLIQPETNEVAPAPGHWPSPPPGADDWFARMLEATPTALILSSHDGLIEMMSRQAERLFGYPREELYGVKLEKLFPERLRQQVSDLRRAFPSDIPAPMMNESPNLFGLRKDGSEFPTEIGLGGIVVAGKTMLLAGIIDATARHKVEVQKEQYRLELERSNADLEEFAYAASHDLKAPLRAITHLVGWISEDLAAATNPETRENLSLLQGRTARLQMLLDGLLAYSRVGRTEVAPEQVDLNEVVREIEVMLAPPPGFVITCEGTLPVIRTDRASIRIVLENLIGNAWKHHDRSEGHVSISARQTDEVTEFRVADDGPGIDPRFHERIFVIFQTLASRDDVEASGIGLAIVKKKVLIHGGRVWVESAPPVRGTTIGFTWKVSV